MLGLKSRQIAVKYRSTVTLCFSRTSFEDLEAGSIALQRTWDETIRILVDDFNQAQKIKKGTLPLDSSKIA
jgi:hypothetical protein